MAAAARSVARRAPALPPRRSGRADQVRRRAGAHLSGTPYRAALSLLGAARRRSVRGVWPPSPGTGGAAGSAQGRARHLLRHQLRSDVAGLGGTRRATLAWRSCRSPARALLRRDRRRRTAVTWHAATPGPHGRAGAPIEPDAFDRLERRAPEERDRQMLAALPDLVRRAIAAAT